MTKPLDLYRFRGSHREIGRQYGTSCRALIRQHVERVASRLDGSGVDLERATDYAQRYRPHVERHAPDLDDEIVGLAEGAGISVSTAYLLQIRAEVLHGLSSPTSPDECTTFAVRSAATSSGIAMIGQNADLPEFYADLMVVIEFAPETGPAVMMVTPAGQISYIGINDRGMGVFANFLQCDGWRVGFPRYLYSRYALGYPNTDEVCGALRGLPRASSRNMLVMDRSDTVIDFENTPDRDAVLRPSNDILAHSNHYVSASLADAERSTDPYLQNSRTRLARITSLLVGAHGNLEPKVVANILRDRHTAPDALSVHPEDPPKTERSETGSRSMTVASVIAEPGAGRMWVSPGPPSRNDYTAYSFADGRDDTTSV